MSVNHFRMSILLGSLAMLSVWGCQESPSSAQRGESPAKSGHGHEHPHDHPTEGPHQGRLIELGAEEYHAELVHDAATGVISIHLLGSDAKTPAPIAEPALSLNLLVEGRPLQARLDAAPQADDPPGTSSRFSLVDEAVFQALESSGAKGRLNVTIAGKPYSGEIAHRSPPGHRH